MDNASIKKLEADLWESADLLRAGSKLTSNQYCMPVLGLLFLRYAYSRYKMVEEEILKDRPIRNGRKMPVEASDFTAKSALFLPVMAQFDYLVNLPENVASLGLLNVSGQTMGSLGEVVNNAMELVEQQSDQLTGVLPKSYTDFSDELLGELLRIFNNNEKFGEGEYKDILGLCKVASLTEIEEKGWSLTPGAYVGVAPVEDDGVDFEERMAEIHRELLSLQAESNDLMDTISNNMKEMGL